MLPIELSILLLTIVDKSPVFRTKQVRGSWWTIVRSDDTIRGPLRAVRKLMIRLILTKVNSFTEEVGYHARKLPMVVNDESQSPVDAAGSTEPRHGQRDRNAGARLISDSMVVAITPHGPMLAGHTAPLRYLRKRTTVPALGPRGRVLIAALTGVWLISVACFWWWWSGQGHRSSWIGLIVGSVVSFYLACESASVVIAANRQQKINPELPVQDLRVAFLVTRAPSEPWDVAKATITAMLAQQYPHRYDVWLCDEQPTAEVIDWCAENNVHISSRSGVPAYHRDRWPRRTRAKEGNLAHFYDHVGYLNYDVVAQLDCDHIPAPGYLAEVVRPFADPAIGYVAAPSVCDRSTANSWSARGRLHHEAQFHGPIQLGHNGGVAPICIGSHYVVRTEAIKQIGGIGPELLEDFSTSLLLNSAGWQGGFAITAEAHGNGPLTFSAMLVQEFQWARSLTSLLYRNLPRHFGRLSWRLRIRYLHAMLSQAGLVLAFGSGIGFITVAATTTRAAEVAFNPFQVILFWIAMTSPLLAISVVLKRQKFYRPATAPLLSWERLLYQLTRWPAVAWGVLAATLQLFHQRPIMFKVTPKTVEGSERLPVALIAPYAVIGVVLSAAAIIGELSKGPTAYILLCLLGAAAYLFVSFAVCLLHAAEGSRCSKVGMRQAIRETVRGPILVASFGVVPLSVSVAATFL